MSQNEIFEKIFKIKKEINRIYKLLDPGINNMNYTNTIILMKIPDSGITMTKLSELTGFSTTLITFTVNDLEKQGLVERKKGSDRRNNIVVLSDKGKGIKEDIIKIVSLKKEELIKKLDDQEKLELNSLLDRISEILEKLANNK